MSAHLACLVCSEPIVARTKQQRYCSLRCRRLKKTGLPPKTCQYCEAPIEQRDLGRWRKTCSECKRTRGVATTKRLRAVARDQGLCGTCRRVEPPPGEKICLQCRRTEQRVSLAGVLSHPDDVGWGAWRKRVADQYAQQMRTQIARAA
jgi:hypothetical protein